MSDSKSPWPKDGLAGQVSAAARIAPDHATDRQIIKAAYAAWEESRDVRETLEEVMGDGE